MSAFILRRDLEGARREIESCKGTPDALWLFSLAFIPAYEGNLDDAYRSYQKAFARPLSDQSAVGQVEEFIQRVIDEEPDRPWLYFCLGLINHKAKFDLASAETDFQKFLSGVDHTRFPRQVEAAKKWLSEITGLTTTREPRNS
jgi:hypothetical protein